MGAVVAAQHLRLSGQLAVKFLHPSLAHDAANIERFVREAKAASTIRSEHVIRVLDVGATEDGLPFIAMELLEGNDLADLLTRGPLPVTLAVDCVLQAAEALAEAHAAGIVHRDVKPSNLWLSQRPDGSPFVKVLDFGISKLAATDTEVQLTKTQAVFGSPTYMSPEQIRSSKRVDHRTDVWALGVVLYELLTGRVPFDADNVAGVLAAVTADTPLPVTTLRPEVPAQLERVVSACLVKDPAQRASLGELATGLRPFASPAGLLSANRIDGIAKPVVSVIPPPSTNRSIPSVAITATIPSILPPPPRSRMLVIVASATLALLGIAIGGIALARRPSADSTTITPAPSETITPSTQPASEPPPVAPPTPPPTVVPSQGASAPAPARSGRGRPGTVKSAVPRASGAPPAPTNGSPYAEDRR
jgi:serine/threonine protein kinase